MSDLSDWYAARRAEKYKYGCTEEPRVLVSGDAVSPKTGKWKGKQGYVMHESFAYPLNPVDRVYAVRIQTGRGTRLYDCTRKT